MVKKSFNKVLLNTMWCVECQKEIKTNKYLAIFLFELSVGLFLRCDITTFCQQKYDLKAESGMSICNCVCRLIRNYLFW